MVFDCKIGEISLTIKECSETYKCYRYVSSPCDNKVAAMAQGYECVHCELFGQPGKIRSIWVGSNFS